MLSVILGSSLIDRAVVRGFVAIRPLHKHLYELRHREVKAPDKGADQKSESQKSESEQATQTNRALDHASKSGAVGASKNASRPKGSDSPKVRLPKGRVRGRCVTDPRGRRNLRNHNDPTRNRAFFSCGGIARDTDLPRF